MRHLIVLLTLALMAVGLIAGPAVAVGDVSDTIAIRLQAGNNAPGPISLRFSQATFPEGTRVEEVLLATDSAFADALASGVLQGDDTPLLLTGRDVLRADVATEIDRLGARRVTILGGEAALSDRVEDALTDVGLAVTRAAGRNRFETAVAIAELVGDSNTAIIARGFAADGDDTQAFADALAAGAWAAEEGWPIFLTQTDELTAATRDAIADADITDVKLLGGEAAISPQVEADLEELGVDVERVFGSTRFHTATAIADARGFATSEDAERIILVEGQSDDAWAAGFTAAAHGAQASAPVVLANGDALPPATMAFLRPEPPIERQFAVDADDVTDAVLVCAASAAACDEARELLGLPREAELTLDEPEGGVPSRSTLTGTLELFDSEASVAIFGDCVTDGLLVPGEDGAIEIGVQAQPGVCQLQVEVRFANGTVQRITSSILVSQALPQQGVVVNTETGGGRYSFVPDEGDEVITVTYDADDRFAVDGQDATIGAFEASLTLADQILFRADTAEGTVHELTNVDPDTITSGTVGNVNLALATFAIIEPVSGVTLRGGIAITDEDSYAIGDRSTDREGFEADINEGDRIELGTTTRLTNQVVTGRANGLLLDPVSGIARFRIDALGDDPANAEDERFRAVAASTTQNYRVDGSSTGFAGFAAALSEGDLLEYRRANGVESFRLDNAALPRVEGLVTETYNPDGSPVAPEPADGGQVTILTPRDGRRSVEYSPDAVFRIDGRIATEAEFEAQRTPGDGVSYQAGDPATETEEEIVLVNRDLTGDLADITPGEKTFDVVVLSGVVYDDLPYTGAIFGGSDTYVINGSTVGLAQFENELALVARGEVIATLVVRPAGGDTQHRLTSEDV